MDRDIFPGVIRLHGMPLMGFVSGAFMGLFHKMKSPAHGVLFRAIHGVLFRKRLMVVHNGH